MKNILEYNAQGATIRFDQRELLLVMALIQEGRESFGCNTVSGKALDDLFCMAIALVDVARRENRNKAMAWQKARMVATFEPAAHTGASNDVSGNQMAWFKRF